MKTIWKAPLIITSEEQFVKMPEGANIRSVQMQNGSPAIWFECYPKSPESIRIIQIFGTGHPIEQDGDIKRYISTVQVGALVWHFFEVIKYDDHKVEG